MVRICLAGCSDPDRQTGSDTSRYFGKSTFFFFSESRRGPVTPPASQQSATQKFSGPECLKSVISVTLDISGVAAQCPPRYWAKCRAEMRQIYQGGTSRRRRRRGRPHLGTTDACSAVQWGHDWEKGVIECNHLIYNPLWGMLHSPHTSHFRLWALTHLPRLFSNFPPLPLSSNKCAVSTVSADLLTFYLTNFSFVIFFPMHFTVMHFCLQVGILFPVFRSLFISQASHKYPKVWADYKEKSKLVATVKHIFTTLEYLSSILFHCKTSASSVFQFGIWTSSRKRCGRKLHWNFAIVTDTLF